MTAGPGTATASGPPQPPGHLDLRGTLAVLAGLAVAVAAVLPFLLWWHRLPSPMAVHWNAAGAADGALAKAAAAAVSMIPAGLLGLGAAALCLPSAAGLRSPGALAAAKLASIAAGIGTLLAVTAWSTVVANMGARTWREASPLGLPLIALGILAGIAVLLGMAWLTQVRPRAAGPAAGPGAPDAVRPAAAPPAGGSPVPGPPGSGPLAPGRAAWAGRARLTWWVPMVLVVAAAVNAVLTLARGVPLVMVIPLGTLLLAYLALGWIRVSVDWRGLRIHYGLLPWPVTAFPLSRIQSAGRIDLKPLQWGGWGYRGSRTAFGRAAVVLRGGDAIRVRLTDGSEFAVTVDDAAAGAALLTDLLTAAPTPR